MDADKKDVPLDGEALDAGAGAGLTDALKRVEESVLSDGKSGFEIGGRGPAQIIGASIGGYVGLIKGIKNEIF